jgi:hypothetical protein
VTGFSLAHLPMISGTCLPPTLRTTSHNDRHCIKRNEVLRTAHPDRRERPSSDWFWQNSEAIRPVNPRRQARHLAAANPGSHFSRPAAIRTLLIIDRASSPAFATDVLAGTRAPGGTFSGVSRSPISVSSARVLGVGTGKGAGSSVGRRDVPRCLYVLRESRRAPARQCHAAGAGGSRAGQAPPKRTGRLVPVAAQRHEEQSAGRNDRGRCPRSQSRGATPGRQPRG